MFILHPHLLCRPFQSSKPNPAHHPSFLPLFRPSPRRAPASAGGGGGGGSGVLRPVRSTIAEIARQRRRQPRQEFADALLVLCVLRVFTGGDVLCEDGRGLEEDDVGDGADDGPVVERVGHVAGPLVEEDPDCWEFWWAVLDIECLRGLWEWASGSEREHTLLGGEVGMAAPGPETGHDEASV